MSSRYAVVTSWSGDDERVEYASSDKREVYEVAMVLVARMQRCLENAAIAREPGITSDGRLREGLSVQHVQGRDLVETLIWIEELDDAV